MQENDGFIIIIILIIITIIIIKLITIIIIKLITIINIIFKYFYYNLT